MQHLFAHHTKELEHDPERDVKTVLNFHEYHVDTELKTGADDTRNTTLAENTACIEKELLTCHGEQERATEEVAGMLRVLGFDETGEQAPLNSLSGGMCRVITS
jgi:ATPase subunit of ABC transporter with duplicated ATPase domains